MTTSCTFSCDFMCVAMGLVAAAAARGKKKKGKELMEEKRGEEKGGLVKSWDSPHEVSPPTVVDELPGPDPAASHHPPADEFVSALGVDMVREVLVRLPVKALFRFMCISKKYHDMISDAAFKRWYRRRQLRLDSPPLAVGLVYQAYNNVGGGHLLNHDIPTVSLRLIRSSAAYSGEDDDDLYDGCGGGDTVVDMRMNYFTDPVLVLDSCKGLLLLSQTVNQWRKYHICNPITRQWVTLPPHPGKVYRNRSAMLYIPSREEEEEEEEKQVVEEGGPRHYKVILLSLTVRSVGINSHTAEVAIFSSETGKWMEYKIQCPVSRLPRHSIALEGALYHLYPAGVLQVQHVGAVVYLAKDNCMHLLALPSDVNEGKCLGMSGGSLHHAGIRESNGCCRIWVLLPQLGGGGGGGEWSLKHVVYLFPCIPWISRRLWWLIEPLGFHPTQPHLIFLKIRGCGESGDMVLSCDTQRGNMLKCICFHKTSPEQVSRYSFFPYVSPAWPTFIPQANN